MAVIYNRVDRTKPAVRYHCTECGRLIRCPSFNSEYSAFTYCRDCIDLMKVRYARDDGELSQDSCE